FRANWYTIGEDPLTHVGGAGSGQPWSVVTGCNGTNPVAGTPTAASVPTSPPVQPTANPPSTGWVVSQAAYNSMITYNTGFYSYDGFLKGAQTVGGFCTSGDVAHQKAECAAFLANMSHETGSGQYVTEIAKGI